MNMPWLDVEDETAVSLVDYDDNLPDADSMRHGAFVYEVVGNDYAASVRHGLLDVGLQRTHTNPRVNQAEGGTPLHSRDGAALFRNLPRTVRQMEPLYNAPKFGGQLGVTLVRNAKNIPLVYLSGYDGILPLTEQPKIDKPYPYGPDYAKRGA